NERTVVRLVRDPCVVLRVMEEPLDCKRSLRGGGTCPGIAQPDHGLDFSYQHRRTQRSGFKRGYRSAFPPRGMEVQIRLCDVLEHMIIWNPARDFDSSGLEFLLHGLIAVANPRPRDRWVARRVNGIQKEPWVLLR